MSEFRENARRFAIWREGTAVNWDCTLEEISQATSIPIEEVRKTCKSRKWSVRKTDHQPDDLLDLINGAQ
jgi:hypothetical protein